MSKRLPHFHYKAYAPLLAILTLSGCALALEYPLTSAGLGVWGVTGKSPTDHAVSYVTDQDCDTLRLLSSQEMCKSTRTQPVEVVDRSTRLDKTDKK